MRDSRVLLNAVALVVASCGCRGAPEDGTGARGASLGGFGPAVTTPVADVTANVFVLELWLPEGLSHAEAEAAEMRALQREAAELELEVTETKVEMGLVEKTQWARRTVTVTEEGCRASGAGAPASLRAPRYGGAAPPVAWVPTASRWRPTPTR